MQLCRELEPGSPRRSSTGPKGKPLEDVLAETEMAPGDFVRNCKQLVDLLRQIEEVAAAETAALVRAGARERSCAASSPTRGCSYDAGHDRGSPFGTWR